MKLIDIINTITDGKRIKRIYPDHALRSEIMLFIKEHNIQFDQNEFTDQMNDLRKRRVIKRGNTINDIYFKILENGKTKN